MSKNFNEISARVDRVEPLIRNYVHNNDIDVRDVAFHYFETNDEKDDERAAYVIASLITYA